MAGENLPVWSRETYLICDDKLAGVRRLNDVIHRIL